MDTNLNIGDIVARKSYNNDVFFKIVEMVKTDSGQVKARLRGLDVRLLADSPLEDLTKVEGEHIREYRKKFIRQNNDSLKKIFSRRAKDQGLKLLRLEDKFQGDFFEMPGRVLHIDGNLEYLNLCIEIYEQLGIKSKGIHIPENEQPASVPELLKENSPDILVLTGHDGIIKSTERYSDIENYHNSKYFVEAVRAARRIECNRDNLIIFAGACQSHYEAILSAGANYGSSPMRVFIHAFDPVFIVEKIAFTPISQIISINEVIDSTITGIDGLGGIETRGKYRKGFPKSPY
ncbi:MAG: sporulation peptidase YabG [Eubacteriales bacterium]